MIGKITLGYWKIRGRGQVPRLLLAYTGAIWEDVHYTDPSQWFGADKESLGFHFPNLPYVIEDQFKLTETIAVIRYIAERSTKKQLIGKDIQDRAIVTALSCVIIELFDKIVGLFYNSEYEKHRADTWEAVRHKIDQLINLKGNKTWLMPYLTINDFLLVELSYYLEKLYPEHYEKLHSIQELRVNFINLDEIKKYYAQESSIKAPFCSPFAAKINF